MKILITGATSGIGRQLALDYAAAQHSVIACGRNEEALAALKQQFPQYVIGHNRWMCAPLRRHCRC